MELTYTTTNNGYTILSGGVPWIIQDGYIPYPGQDMAEAAENHIDQISTTGPKPRNMQTNRHRWRNWKQNSPKPSLPWRR